MVNGCLTLFLALSFTAGSACQTKGANTPALPANAAANKAAANTSSASGGQKVTIDSPDGVKLVGTLYAAEKPNSPAVLLLHQWQSDRHSYDDFAKRMHANGFGVLSMDGRGFGESTKAADGTNVSAERTDAAVEAMLGDVGTAFDYLSKQAKVDPSRVGIVGASYGSSLALIYAADNIKVRAVALLSPGLNYFGNMQTEPAFKKYGPQRPVLLIAAKDDRESDESVTKLAAGSANDSKVEIIQCPKGAHGTALLNGCVGSENSIESFLTKSLAQ